MPHCKVCDTEKPASEFNKISRAERRDGLAQHCQPCYAEYGRRWRASAKGQGRMRPYGGRKRCEALGIPSDQVAMEDILERVIEQENCHYCGVQVPELGDRWV